MFSRRGRRGAGGAEIYVFENTKTRKIVVSDFGVHKLTNYPLTKLPNHLNGVPIPVVR